MWLQLVQAVHAIWSLVPSGLVQARRVPLSDPHARGSSQALATSRCSMRGWAGPQGSPGGAPACRSGPGHATESHDDHPHGHAESVDAGPGVVRPAGHGVHAVGLLLKLLAAVEKVPWSQGAGVLGLAADALYPAITASAASTSGSVRFSQGWYQVGNAEVRAHLKPQTDWQLPAHRSGAPVGAPPHSNFLNPGAPYSNCQPASKHAPVVRP